MLFTHSHTSLPSIILFSGHSLGFEVILYHLLMYICKPERECNETDIRLVDGQTVYDGRVEICLEGIWGFTEAEKGQRFPLDLTVQYSQWKSAIFAMEVRKIHNGSPY